MKQADIIEIVSGVLGLDEKDVIITKCTEDGEVVIKMVNLDVDDPTDDAGDEEDDDVGDESDELGDEDDKEKELQDEADDASDIDE